MGYLENNLMKNEKVIYHAYLHWWIFVPPAISIIIGIMILSNADSTMSFLGGIVLVLGALSLIGALIRKVTSEFAVTNRRIILKSGLIKRNSNELYLNKAEGMNIDQGILGRIFGFGSIIITSGGATNRYKTVSNPLMFRKMINEQVEEGNLAAH